MDREDVQVDVLTLVAMDSRLRYNGQGRCSSDCTDSCINGLSAETQWVGRVFLWLYCLLYKWTVY